MTGNCCPLCGSRLVVSDYDPDIGKWWTCRDCQHDWTYADENKVLDLKSTEGKDGCPTR